MGEFRFGQGGGNDSGAGGGLAIADGYLFVADTRNDRIQRMALDGSGATVIVPTGAVKRPQGLAARSGRLIVADDNGHRMVVYDYNGAQLTTFGTGPGNKPGQLSFPYDVGIDALGRVFVADNINHRVVRYGPGPKYTYRGRWGSYGSRIGQLQYPRGIAVAPNGDQFVADPGGNRIDVFDFQGAPKGFFGSSGRVTGQFIRPLGVATDASGVRAVADSVNGRVQLLNPDGSVITAFGAPAPGPTLLPDPVSVAFDARGLLYVLDQQRSRVLVFDRGGKIIRTIGSRGRSAGQLLAPSAVAVSGRRDRLRRRHRQRADRPVQHQRHPPGLDRALPQRARRRGLRRRQPRLRDRRRHEPRQRAHRAGQRRRPRSAPATCAHPPSSRSTAPATCSWPTAATTAWSRSRPRGRRCSRGAMHGVGPGQFMEPTGISVSCNGLVTVAEADNNRVQQFQLPATAACGALPPITPPPNPILATQPDPVPPDVFLAPTRTSGILGGASVPAAGALRRALPAHRRGHADAAREEDAGGEARLHAADAPGGQHGDRAPAAQRGGPAVARPGAQGQARAHRRRAGDGLDRGQLTHHGDAAGERHG